VGVSVAGKALRVGAVGAGVSGVVVACAAAAPCLPGQPPARARAWAPPRPPSSPPPRRPPRPRHPLPDPAGPPHARPPHARPPPGAGVGGRGPPCHPRRRRRRAVSPRCRRHLKTRPAPAARPGARSAAPVAAPRPHPNWSVRGGTCGAGRP
jgi:hypothetical protein